MISIEQALRLVVARFEHNNQAVRMPAEQIRLAECIGRILREDVLADADSPPFDKAIRDGFAVLHSDLQPVPVTRTVIGEARAGVPSCVRVEAGTCCEIMTGAPLPAGATAVVMVEHSERLSPSSVRILRSVREGEGVLRRAAEARSGEQILSTGSRLRMAHIGPLAAAGKAMVLVSQRPRVAILATGDELVEVAEQPAAGQIRNSNTYTLAAQVIAAGASPTILGIARDNLEDLRQKIGIGLEHDILLVSGGVSMGKYDFVEDVFAEFGVTVVFDQVAMKPGKPTVFGYRDRTFVYGLPGNPVSTIVAFHLFVRPLILRLLQEEDAPTPLLEARLEATEKRDPLRTAVVPALVRFESGSYQLRSAPWKGSSDLVGLSRANALVFIPQGDGAMQPGERAEFLFLE